MNIQKIFNKNKKYGQNFTGRKDFIESFLFEEPQYLESNIWEQLKNDIYELKSRSPNKIHKLGNNFYKLEFVNDVYYWFEQNDEFILGCSLDKKVHGFVVVMTGKNPKYSKQYPYASDLYLGILKDIKDNEKSIIISDKFLSKDGYKIWKRLLGAGHKISLYNINQPGKFIQINSLDQLQDFMSNEKEKREYRYVLSESEDDRQSISVSFKKRKYYEDNNLSMED
jgi:hypothetical protein